MGKYCVAAAAAAACVLYLMLCTEAEAAVGSKEVMNSSFSSTTSSLEVGMVNKSAEAEAEAEACVSSGGGSITLSFDFYLNSCPEAEAIVFSWVEKAVSDDPRMAASLLRLHFHDCFVNGCDASVLLDEEEMTNKDGGGGGGGGGEKAAGPNANSLRGFEVIDGMKAEIEYFCPHTVSCADILAIAARDSVFLSGGPRWEVEMGRKDGFISNKTAANSNIPSPNSDLPTLLSHFHDLGLSLKDLIALSGAHTIGKARCSTFSNRTPDADVNLQFLHSLQQLCADTNTNTNTNTNTTILTHLDHSTPTTFDNAYFLNILSGEGLLASDQALLQVPTLVESYANDVNLFFQDFANSMLAMGSLQAQGAAGEIRTNCRAVNANPNPNPNHNANQIHP